MCQCNRCNNNRKCPAATDSKSCDFKFGKVRNYWQSQLQYYMQRIAHEQMDADNVEHSALLNDVQKRSQTEAEAYYKKKRDDREAARLKRKQPEVPKPRKVKQEVPNAAPPIKMEAPNQIVIPDANAMAGCRTTAWTTFRSSQGATSCRVRKACVRHANARLHVGVGSSPRKKTNGSYGTHAQAGSTASTATSTNTIPRTTCSCRARKASWKNPT